MTPKKIGCILWLIGCFSLLIFVRPAFADPDPKDVVLHDTATFIKKGSINDFQLMNTPTRIWAFTTNGGEAKNVPAVKPVTVELELIQLFPRQQTIKGVYSIVINSGQLSGSTDVIFPTAGKWMIKATGTIDNGKKTENFVYTSNIFTVTQINKLLIVPEEKNIDIGESIQYHAYLFFKDGTFQDITDRVLWSSEKSEIASITPSGKAKGNAEGQTTIHATDPRSGLSDDALLIVASKGLGLEIRPSTATIGVGNKQQYDAFFFFYIGDYRFEMKVTNSLFCSWTSSQPDVGSISSSSLFSWNDGGLAKGLSPGESTITAHYRLFDLEATAILKVQGLTIIPNSQIIKLGETGTFEAFLIHSDSNREKLTEGVVWSSSDESIAGIDSAGAATGLAEGNTTITAIYNGLKATANLIVQKDPMVGPAADHLGFVSSTGSTTGGEGSPVYPQLKLRGDTLVTDSTWAYIGEPMTIEAYLQAFSKEGQPINNYSWDTNWFSRPNNWRILTSENGNRLSSPNSIINVKQIYIGGVPTLQVFMQLAQEDPSDIKLMANYILTLSPQDQAGIAAPVTQALVPGTSPGSVYQLYRGQIRAADDYFYEASGKAQVFVERYNGSQYVANDADSQTSIMSWNLDGVPVMSNFQFRMGRGEVPVRNDASNVTKILTPIGYPTYLRLDEGSLTWGQIVDNPPPQNPFLNHDEGPVWERELLP